MENKNDKIIKKKKKHFIVRLIFVFLFIILIPFFAIYYFIKWMYKLNKHRKWKKELRSGEEYILGQTLTSIDLMEGYEFEYFLKNLFFYDGFDCSQTPKRGDYGADLIINTQTTKTIIQAKRYSKKVGSKSVQEIIAAKKHYKATDAMVVTNNFFTNQAEEIARENAVRLVDRLELKEILDRVKDKLSENISRTESFTRQDDFDRYQI